MLTRAQENGIREFHDLDGDILRLIALARHDLHCGPVIEPDDGKPWPGFAGACRAIREALESCRVWVDSDGYVTGDPPSDEDGESWVEVDTSAVRRILVGRDLAEYV